MITVMWYSFAYDVVCVFSESEQGPHEKRLLNKLLNDYNVLERPVANESEPLLLSFGLTLQQIIDVVSWLSQSMERVSNAVHCLITVKLKPHIT